MYQGSSPWAMRSNGYGLSTADSVGPNEWCAKPLVGIAVCRLTADTKSAREPVSVARDNRAAFAFKAGKLDARTRLRAGMALNAAYP